MKRLWIFALSVMVFMFLVGTLVSFAAPSSSHQMTPTVNGWVTIFVLAGLAGAILMVKKQQRIFAMGASSLNGKKSRHLILAGIFNSKHGPISGRAYFKINKTWMNGTSGSRRNDTNPTIVSG